MTCNLHHSQFDKVAAEAAHDQPMTATESILITVVICTHNRAARLRDTLRSILPRLTADTELMVVDNASTDETGAVCAGLLGHEQRRVYLVEPRLGLSAARNTALVRARGEFVLFVDDDVLVESGWLQSYRAFLLAPPSSKVGVLGGGVVPFFACPRPKWIWPEYGVLECGDKLLKWPRADSGVATVHTGAQRLSPRGYLTRNWGIGAAAPFRARKPNYKPASCVRGGNVGGFRAQPSSMSCNPNV